MKNGEYFIYKTERLTYIVAHESGEAMECTEEQMVAALKTLWEEGF